MFDTDGIATTVLGSMIFVRAMAIQSDGKIVVAGSSYKGGTGYDFAIVRYNPDGTLDLTFNGDGIVTTNVGSTSDYAYAMAIQSDGKIVVAGRWHNGTNYDIALARYDTDGLLGHNL